LSSPFCEKVWAYLASGFCGSEFAATMDAERFFGSAATVIADSAIAARLAGLKLAFNSTAAQTAGISRVRKVA
jgi:hypothetical protein